MSRLLATYSKKGSSATSLTEKVTKTARKASSTVIPSPVVEQLSGPSPSATQSSSHARVQEESQENSRLGQEPPNSQSFQERILTLLVTVDSPTWKLSCTTYQELKRANAHADVHVDVHAHAHAHAHTHAHTHTHVHANVHANVWTIHRCVVVAAPGHLRSSWAKCTHIVQNINNNMDIFVISLNRLTLTLTFTLTLTSTLTLTFQISSRLR